MTIASTTDLARAAHTAPPAAKEAPEGAETTPSAPASSIPPDDQMRERILDKLVASEAFNEKVLGKMKNGEEVTISVEDGKVTIRSEGPTIAERITAGARATIGAAAQEASGVIKADPAFAFKEAALVAKTQVSSGLPGHIGGLVEQGFLPVIRAASLALNVKKFLDTRKDPNASKLDKGVDAAHVGTDVAGLAGAVAFSVPLLGALAVPLTVVGFAGDVFAYAYHILQYARERGAQNEKAGDGAPPATQPPQPPAPAPPQQPQDPTQMLLAS